MKIIYSKWLPPKGYSMIMLVVWLVIRIDCKESIRAHNMRHEAIHLHQCREMLWLPFYIWYVVEAIARFLFILCKSRPKFRMSRLRAIYKIAYHNISFEREAYANEWQSNYLKERKRWAWVRCIRKKRETPTLL